MDGLTILQAMLNIDNHPAFRLAASNGHLAIINRLCELAPDAVTDMVKVREYCAFKFAAGNGHLDVVNQLLEYPVQFAYSESHDWEYGASYVYPFIESKLSDLRAAKDEFESQNPNGVFDLANERACRLGFYMLRNLICRNNAELLDDMRILLSIPGIKNIVHLAISPNEENELLRLALTVGNESACGLLLTIPAVRQLAEANHYYVAEQQGNIDLRAFAQDGESSMRALTTAEAGRLKRLNGHYQSFIQNTGIENIVNALKETLESRYNANPAVMDFNGKKIILPFDWESFCNLGLTDSQRVLALKAYYQHKDHTAYRYLSRPNHWMSPEAGYVCINDARDERWSTFEEYLPLIALLWVAAQDKEIGTVDEHSVESRINHFIDELAQIGRAHNWDRVRSVMYPDGSERLEEYDDLEGDKPSCYSGVKRRLFQSLIGHPLFRIFSEDVLEQEFNQVARAHFESCITIDNVNAIHCAIEAVNDGFNLTKEQQDLMSLQDIPAEIMDKFVDDMRQKYKESIQGLPLSQWANQKFALTGSITCHLFKFYNQASIQSIVDDATNTLSRKRSLNGGEGGSRQAGGSNRFFHGSQPHENNDENDDEDLPPPYKKTKYR